MSSTSEIFNRFTKASPFASLLQPSTPNPAPHSLHHLIPSPSPSPAPLSSVVHLNSAQFPPAPSSSSSAPFFHPVSNSRETTSISPSSIFSEMQHGPDDLDFDNHGDPLPLSLSVNSSTFAVPRGTPTHSLRNLRSASLTPSPAPSNEANTVSNTFITHSDAILILSNLVNNLNTEKTELQRHVKSLEKNIAVLKNEIKTLLIQMRQSPLPKGLPHQEENFRKMILQLRKTTQRLNTDIGILHQNNFQLEVEKEELGKKYKSLKSAHEALGRKHENVKAENKALKIENEEQQKQIQKLLKENRSLKIDIESLEEVLAQDEPSDLEIDASQEK